MSLLGTLTAQTVAVPVSSSHNRNVATFETYILGSLKIYFVDTAKVDIQIGDLISK
jgi:hypothetical protein